MSLPEDYVELLELVAEAFSRYEQVTGVPAVLVGGAATAIMTAGDFMSGDLDVVASDYAAFDKAMLDTGFRGEDRVGHLLRGYYHPAYRDYGVEQVSGPLFDGQSDPAKRLRLTMRAGEIVLPSYEDIIADRLGQYAIASNSDDSRLRQARSILKVAKSIDVDYLLRRIEQDGGDAALLDVEQIRAGRT